MKKKLLILAILINISLSAQEITKVESSIIEFSDKKYGIDNLKLLVYPSIDKIVESLVNQTNSNKCKIWYKLKVKKELQIIKIDTVVSNCEFENKLKIERQLQSQTKFYIIESNLKDTQTEVTIPLIVYKQTIKHFLNTLKH